MFTLNLIKAEYSNNVENNTNSSLQTPCQAGSQANEERDDDEENEEEEEKSSSSARRIHATAVVGSNTNPTSTIISSSSPTSHSHTNVCAPSAMQKIEIENKVNPKSQATTVSQADVLGSILANSLGSTMNEKNRNLVIGVGEAGKTVKTENTQIQNTTLQNLGNFSSSGISKSQLAVPKLELQGVFINM